MADVQRKSCPACFDQYADHFAFCPKDGAQLQRHGKHRAPSREGKICPTCRRCYGVEAELCPRDSEPLMPYGLFAAQASVNESEYNDAPGVCARCGARGSLGQAFCATDGERLAALH